MHIRHGAIPALLLLLAVPGQSAAQTGAGGSTATGVSRAFNPAISLNALFLGTRLSGDPGGSSELAEGLRLQEAEMQFTSFVDPYFKADVIIGVGEGTASIEEAYLTSQALPFGWTARIGQHLAAFGKQNQLHTHQFPFVEPPLTNSMLFGEEGLNEFGAELSYLLPTPFYLQVSGTVLNGDNAFFAPDSTGTLAAAGRVNALWDLSESTTLEVGASMVGGRSGWSDRAEQVVGADLTVKWRPPRRSLYTQAEWQVEYLKGSRLPMPGADRTWGGITTHLRYRFSRIWWLGARYEQSGVPSGTLDPVRRYAAQFAWVPGEFELWRLQYSRTEPGGAGVDPFDAFFLQMTFTIGSHPAHKY